MSEEINKENLLLLADELENVVEGKKDFDMSLLFGGDINSRIPSHICGSVACALGYGIMVVPPIEDDYTSNSYLKLQFDYTKFSERAFGLKFLSKEWDWCFSSYWHVRDNTALGASLRIRYFVEHGVPRDFDAEYISKSHVKLYTLKRGTV